MKQNRSIELALIVCALLLAVLLVRMCGTGSTSKTSVTENVTILPPETLYVDKVQAQIRWRTKVKYDTVTNTYYEVDTVFETRPFTACMDTVIGCNRFQADYNYPENTFNNISVVTCPDTVITYDTVTTILTDDRRWEYAGYGLLGGFILGTLAK